MIRLITNKFAKNCFTCSKKVACEQGYAVVENLTWSTYHKECLPEKYKSIVIPEKKASFVKEISENVISIGFEYNPRIINEIKQMPYRSRGFNPADKSWEIIVNNLTIEKIKQVLTDLKLEFPKSVKEFVPLSEDLEIEQKKVIDFDFEELKTKGLYDFQIEGVKFLVEHDKGLLGDDMGLGKTIQALMALPKNAAVIIVSPITLMYGWEKETKKWRSDLIPHVIRKKNEFYIPEPGHMVILNRESLPDFFDKEHITHKADYNKELIEKLKTCNLVVDEAHKFKSTKTICSRKIRSISKHTKTCWIITGTPILNKPQDLWGLLASANMEKDAFVDYKNFMQLFNARQGRYGIEFGMPTPEVPKIMSKIRIARKKEKVLPELPSKVFSKLVVSLYDTPEGIRIIKMLDAIDKEASEFLKEGRLPPFTKFSEIRSDIAKNRIPAMLEYIDLCEENETPIIVFSAHVAPLNAIRAHKPNWGVIDGKTPPEMRLKIVENFQAGLLDGIACTIEAAGVGLTMTRAQKVVFVDLDWTPANNWQAEDRICRIGSKHRSVEVVHMISDHPLDAHVHNLIENKKNLIKQSLEIQS